MVAQDGAVVLGNPARMMPPRSLSRIDSGIFRGENKDIILLAPYDIYLYGVYIVFDHVARSY